MATHNATTPKIKGRPMPQGYAMNGSKASDNLDGRARILAAALQVFATSGFEGSSLREIAAHAGVQHQLVVYHFRTKDALWREVVSSIFEESWREQGLSYWADRGRGSRGGVCTARDAAGVRLVHGEAPGIARAVVV